VLHTIVLYGSVSPGGPKQTRRLANAVLLVASALVGAAGVVHLQLWADGYRHVPTLGPLFLAQGVGAVGVGAALAVTRRLALVAAALLLMVGTVAGFLLSDTVGLLGIHDTLSVPFASWALGLELGAIVALCSSALLLVRSSASPVPSTGRRLWTGENELFAENYPLTTASERAHGRPTGGTRRSH
jgi:hypothetical protein